MAVRYQTTDGGKRKAVTKTLLKARRIGGSCAAAIDAANMAAGFEWDGEKWIDALPIDVHIISATNAQAKNVLAEVALFVEKVCEREPRYRAEPKATTIEFATGARIIALSCKPSSLRTYTGAVLFDEFAFYQRPEEVWGAAKTIAASTLKEPRGYPVSAVTTPWAYGGFPHKIFTDETLGFRRQTVDIYTAEKAGFPIDIEQTRKECALAEIFAQEYECQWIKGGACFFDPDLLLNAEREDLPEDIAREPSFYGIDIGRTTDLTVIVEAKRLGDVVWIVGIEALRNVHMDDQRDRAIATLGRTDGHKLGRALIDRGGIGRDLSDHLERRFATRVKGVDFSQDTKEQMAVTFRSALESGRLRFWVGGESFEQVRSLRSELISIKAKAASGGKLAFETPRTATGHGDRAWAAMLAITAAGGGRSADDYGDSDDVPAPHLTSLDTMSLGM